MINSNRDCLTQLGNPELLKVRFGELSGDGAKFGMILFDIDGFIYFNDRYGHDRGDEKLKQIANLISQNVSSGTDVFRSGGDEFIILLPNLTMAKVLLTAMQICETVNQQFSNFPPLRRSVTMPDMSYIEVYFPLTVSCGVAFYPEHGVDYNTLRQSAEDAAFRSGKNLYGGVVGIARNLYESCFLPPTYWKSQTTNNAESKPNEKLD